MVVTDIIGAAITLLLGIAVSLINFLLSRFILKKFPDKYAFSTIFRSLLQVVFLVAVYLVGKNSAVNIFYLLIGGVLGLSIASFFFTFKLLNLNKESIKKTDSENRETSKEDGSNG